MMEPKQRRVSAFLAGLAEDLDIPPSKYKQAVDRYQAVGDWLGREESPLRPYHPDIYPQGSFRLGTIIRPLRDGEEGDYDIDLVCQLQRPQVIGEERRVKHCVGDRLKQHGKYEKMIEEEGRRCWTLKYAEEDGVGFHMDCLPSVPEGDGAKRLLAANGVPYVYAQHAIGITHRRADNLYEWLGSNPRGYAQWFEDTNRSAFTRAAAIQKAAVYERSKAVFASVQEVPDGLVRTPLQRAIQILKRHRDFRFHAHELEKQKPISIIITTLLAWTFENENDVLYVLQGFLRKAEGYATSGLLKKINGQWYIPNPVNPTENFADRWNDAGSRRAEAFFRWVTWAREDLAKALDSGDISGISEALCNSFGAGRLEKVAERLESRERSVHPSGHAVPQLADASHAMPAKWPVHRRYRVSVKGTVHKKIGESKTLWTLSRRPVQKGKGLRFKAQTNTPGDYEIKWQVVNTGEEALADNGLRGGFENGQGFRGQVRWEYTAYEGTHWIEAFVIKDGVCVARSGPIYVRIRK